MHQLFDDAGLNTPWTNKFFYVLGKKKDYADAIKFVYDSMLKGQGLGVMHEDDEIAESTNFTVKCAAAWLDDNERRQFMANANKAGVKATFQDGGDYDSYWTIAGPESKVKKFVENNF